MFIYVKQINSNVCFLRGLDNGAFLNLKKKWIRLHLHDENKSLYSINQYKNILIDIYAKGTLSHILFRFFKKIQNFRILLSLQCIFTVKQ